MTRPRMSGSDVRSSMNASETMLRLCRKPGGDEQRHAEAQVRGEDEREQQNMPRRARGNHQLSGAQRTPHHGQSNRADERADGKTGDQHAKAGLVEAVDILGDIRHQARCQRKRREIDETGEPHGRLDMRRIPDIAQAFDKVAETAIVACCA